MSQTLQRLSLTAFRGATSECTVTFAPDKKITMIFGENGTGKSSIVDAFAFLCEESIGSLEDRSGGAAKHIASITAKPEEVAVQLVTSAGSWRAQLAGSKPTTTPKTGRPPVQILRRAKITRLIEDQPKQRYEVVRPFVHLAGIEKSEGELKKALKAAEDALKQHATAVTTSGETLEDYWKREASPGTDAPTWARAEREHDVSALEAQVAEIDDLTTALEELVRAVGALTAAESGLASAQIQLTSAQTKLTAAEAALPGQATALLAVLQQAQRYLSAVDDLRECPVCAQPVGKQALQKRLQGQIEQLGDLAKAKSEVDAQEKTLERANTTRQMARRSLVGKVAAAVPPFATSTLVCLTPEVFDRSALAQPSSETRSEEDWLRVGALFAAAAEALTEALAEAKKSARATIDRRNGIVTMIDALDAAREKAQAAERLATALRQALQVVEDSRKDHVKAVIEEIEDDVERLYVQMHPDEGLSGFRLPLDPRYQGSLGLRGNFHDQEGIEPQAYFSESHLDTLGLCIFLALARKYNTGNTIVVLDDVVTSVDSGHLDAFVRLLDSECDEFGHVIVTTHYRPWRERYRYHQAPSSKIHFVELRPWSLDRGIGVHTTRLAIDELAHLLDPEHFERQEVASKAGILLEGIFENLSLRFALRMPRKQPAAYTLGEFMGAFDSKFAGLLRVDRCDAEGAVMEQVSIKPLLDTLGQLTWIRNQVGAHFNVAGEEISDGDVAKLGEATLALAKALACPVSGEIPSRNRHGHCWESSGGRTHLYPLTKPGDSTAAIGT